MLGRNPNFSSKAFEINTCGKEFKEKWYITDMNDMVFYFDVNAEVNE